MKYSQIAVAIPLMAESENLPNLVNCLEAQTFQNFKVFFCVNQPESFWQNPEKTFICHNNRESIEYLHALDSDRYFIIDRSSEGKGWDEKRQGVGHARKVLFDTILEKHSDNTIIISLDGDTSFSGNYFQSIVSQFNEKPGISFLKSGKNPISFIYSIASSTVWIHSGSSGATPYIIHVPFSFGIYNFRPFPAA